ncbi:Bax inhibitor-1/YccA family protein [Miniimonas arenae]|uniref:Bax inhibitor-1/YccA family protein n=1 Tax=Miniimonas arenae TaxID=676201 RepID=A0A5C5BCG2_9MICO|nr:MULTISPECIES: Bax inhibitor-1/YccA family protein [Miniimonas]TNU74757.1 Bax inhibitor-1/YccA family protein [Miniimonas arenae]
MSNPYFTNDPYFGESEQAKKQRQQLGVPNVAPAPGQQAYGQPGQYGSYSPTSTLPPVPVAADQLEQQYRMPAAGAAETGRMTYDDVIVKTGLVLGTIVAFGAFSWFAPSLLGMPAIQTPLMIVGLIGGLVLGLVNAFKREPSAGLIMAYAAFEGLFLGAISSVFESQWSGIVAQAVLATVATFVAVLLLFRSGKVRNTPRFQKIVLTALVGYLIFSLVNLVLMWTGVLDGWGLRSGWLGVLIGVAAVVLAAATLVIDFDSIQKGVRRGAPARYAWSAAFGLAVTLVWMYLEFLRLLAILRN